jgi:Xaa-Pro aminopeptidase
MLTPTGCAGRRRRLWEALPEPCNALVLGDPQSLVYFANFAPSPFEFRSSDAGAVLVLQPDRATLIGDWMGKAYLDQSHVDEVVAPIWYDGRHSAPHRKAQLVETARGVLRDMPGARIGLEAASVPAGLVGALRDERPGLHVVEVEKIVRTLRRAKDPDEVELIRRSARAGEAGHAAALGQVEPGMTELDVFTLVQRAATEAAGMQVWVYGDFTSGSRCETERGGPPTLRTIDAGDLFLLDFSVVVHSYRADFANTFVVGGEPTKRRADLYSACQDALALVEWTALRPGTHARDVDRVVRRTFQLEGLERYFTTHSGHGIGLSHPEPPFLVAESDETLAVGDVVAVEPGLYVPAVGGMRFERNYLITPDGFECLTNHALTLEQTGRTSR